MTMNNERANRIVKELRDNSQLRYRDVRLIESALRNRNSYNNLVSALVHYIKANKDDNLDAFLDGYLFSFEERGEC